MAAALKLETLRYAANMAAKGLLDEQFQELLLLQDERAPNFFATVITLFCEDGDRIIGELAKRLDKPSVDFDEVDAFVHQLEDISACVGAKRLKNTCTQFRVVCQEKSRDVCLKIQNAVRSDFYFLRSKFQTLLQLEAGAADPGLYPEQ